MNNNGMPVPPKGREDVVLSPFVVPRGRSRRSWFEKTIEDITGTLEATVFAEEIALRPGLWQGIDARAKVVAAVALILAVSLARSIPVLIGLYMLAILLAVGGRIPLGFFIKRVWLFLPFFTGVIALPALFSFITPGRPLVIIIHEPFVAITEQGLRTVVQLLLRVASSISFAIILILTTRWGVLLGALRALHIPQVFVLVLGITYRYIFLLLHTANDMFLARKSRLVGRVTGSRERAWVGHSMGVLLSKSYHLSDQVYLAMVSRGFRGEAKLLDPLTLKPTDIACAVLALLVPILVVLTGG